MYRPSGDHAGMNSPACESVSRRAVPEGSSAIQSLFNELKTTRLPSGDIAGHRIKRARTVALSSTRFSK
jgi:hypothetical protein